MTNELLLLSGNDIPFLEARVSIHQPRISEIAYIGEEAFLSGSQFLNFSKELLDVKDKRDLENKSDFDIFMSIMCSNVKVAYIDNAKLVLMLLFPDYEILYSQHGIILKKDEFETILNNDNFEIFKDIIISMFAFEDEISKNRYNPKDGRAAKIAEKLQKRHDSLQKKKGKSSKKIAIFSRYISILSVGLGKNMNDYMSYTIYQLKDEFNRFQKKQNFDMYNQLRIAGAKDLDEVDNWMEDIHS